MIENKDFIEAWDRIARTADGHTIYLYLQQRLMAVRVNADDGTLREDNGQRSFASQLLGLMAKGIEESATGIASRLVTISRSGPVAVSSTSGAGRRVTADTIVPGWNDNQPTDGPGASSGTG